MKNTDTGVGIQCPDCGAVLTPTLTRKGYCKECDRTLNENEIRERCGL